MLVSFSDAVSFSDETRGRGQRQTSQLLDAELWPVVSAEAARLRLHGYAAQEISSAPVPALLLTLRQACTIRARGPRLG